MTIAEARTRAAGDLAHSGSGRLDADVLLKWILGVDETYLLFHADTPLTQEQQRQLEEAVARRKTGLAVCYITGKKEFWGLDFDVTRDVLPPKSDTELLVENTLAAVRRRLACLSAGEQVALCDVGAGTGCVGVSVMSDLERLGQAAAVSLVMLDVSEAALHVAKGNATRLLRPSTLCHVSFLQSDLFEALPTAVRFDVIASNPPYISRDETSRLLADGRGEPMLALCGDEDRRGAAAQGDGESQARAEGKQEMTRRACVAPGDGLDVTRRLVRGAVGRLKMGGTLILETGEDQAGVVEQLLVGAGFAHVEVSRDLAGKLRNVQGRLC